MRCYRVRGCGYGRCGRVHDRPRNLSGGSAESERLIVVGVGRGRGAGRRLPFESDAKARLKVRKGGKAEGSRLCVCVGEWSE